MNKIAVVVFGGGALLRSNQRGLLNEQIKNADETCRALLPILEHGYELVMAPGIGPQLQIALTQIEESINRTPPLSLDVCIAQTQGSMAYLLGQSMMRQLRQRGIPKEVANILPQVLVDSADPESRQLTCPIGPYFNEYRAQELMRRTHWKLAEEPGKGYRRLVPMLAPQEILSSELIKRLASQGYVVIAPGGGGAPVAQDDQGQLIGVEAVVDEDTAASLLASEINADFLLLLSEADKVVAECGMSRQQSLDDLSVEEARQCLVDGRITSGPMRSRLQAAIEFLERGGREALITSAKKILSALMGRTGTRICQDSRRFEKLQLQKRLPFIQESELS
jgi:carbamate kinase